MAEAICGAVILVGLGLLSIFARDLLWELTHWSNSIKGVASERTETWDTWSVISGVILVIVGAGLAIAIFSMQAQERREDEQATATVNSRLANLEATYAPIIATLRPGAAFEPQEVRGGRFGLPSTQRLMFGLCQDEDFYLYIISGSSSFRGNVFVQDASPQYCGPDGWNIYDADRLGGSAPDGTWYDISVIQMPTYQVSTFLAPVATSTSVPTATPTPRASQTPAATPKGQQGP